MRRGDRGRLPGPARTGRRSARNVPEIDQVVGVFAREEIAAAADRLLGGLSDGQRTIIPPAAEHGPAGHAAGCGSPPGTWPT